MAEQKVQLKNGDNLLYPVTKADHVDGLQSFIQEEVTSVMNFKGTVGTGGTAEQLPTEGNKQGDCWKVLTKGTYGGIVCEVGDVLIYDGEKWSAVQANIDLVNAITKDSAAAVTSGAVYTMKADHEGRITTAETNATAAKTAAGEAKTEAADAKTTAEAAQSAATTAEGNATNALTKAGEAKTAAGEAKTAASNAETSASKAVSDLATHTDDNDAHGLAALRTEVAGKAASTHTHSQYAATGHKHAIADVTNLQTTLDGKAASTHNHDTAYAAKNHTHTDYAAKSHTHTEYAASSHTHSNYITFEVLP